MGLWCTGCGRGMQAPLPLACLARSGGAQDPVKHQLPAGGPPLRVTRRKRVVRITHVQLHLFRVLLFRTLRFARNWPGCFTLCFFPYSCALSSISVAGSLQWWFFFGGGGVSDGNGGIDRQRGVSVTQRRRRGAHTGSGQPAGCAAERPGRRLEKPPGTIHPSLFVGALFGRSHKALDGVDRFGPPPLLQGKHAACKHGAECLWFEGRRAASTGSQSLPPPRQSVMSTGLGRVRPAPLRIKPGPSTPVHQAYLPNCRRKTCPGSLPLLGRPAGA